MNDKGNKSHEQIFHFTTFHDTLLDITRSNDMNKDRAHAFIF